VGEIPRLRLHYNSTIEADSVVRLVVADEAVPADGQDFVVDVIVRVREDGGDKVAD
jgi:hypothetical protein